MANPFTSRKFKAAEVVVCIEGFAGELDNGKEVRAAKGARVRGDAEIVRRWPEFFAIDGASDDEVQAQRVAVLYAPTNAEMERADLDRREEEARRRPPPPPLAEAAQVVQGFYADGHSYGYGQLVRLDDPIVKKYPERFQLPARPLV